MTTRDKNETRKGNVQEDMHDTHDTHDILDAANRMDLDAVVAAVNANADCFNETNLEMQNAMHILAAAGFFRVKPIVTYLVTSTRISLLQADRSGRDPLDIAIELNDQEGVDYLYPHWLIQYEAQNPHDDPSSDAPRPTIQL